MAKPTKAEAINRLQKALDAILKLRRLDADSPEFEKWRRNTKIAITNTFGDKSRHIQDFTGIYFSPLLYQPSPHEERETYLKGLKLATARLESMIDEVKEYWEDDTQAAGLPKPYDPSEQRREAQTKEHQPPNTKEVFVIHGRDEAAKEKVARFIEQLDLTPVILHEQSNQGRIIIEKFEQHAQVGFAVALLTPDDVGALQTEAKNSKPRARQNVVFELGYFLGRLGRKRVCALVKGPPEIPSDYAGVAYITLDDAGGWKIGLAKELRKAGFKIDMNRIME